MPLPFPSLAALVVALAACVTDIRSRRIPNVLTFGAAAGAFGFFLAGDGISGLGWSMAGCAVGLVVFLPFFALGGIGAGDVKLLAAIGAWVGPMSALWVALAAGVAGGPLAIVVALSSGYLRESFANLRGLLMFWRLAGLQPHPVLTLDNPTTVRLPYALPVALGLMVTLWLRH